MALRSIQKIKRGKELDEILLENEFIEVEDLSRAYEIAANENKSLRQVISENSMVTEVHMAIALAEQYEVEFIDIPNIDIEDEVAKKIPAKIARQYHVVPIEFTNNTLTIAIENPSNMFVIDIIKGDSDINIDPKVAVKEQIAAALQKTYHFDEESDNSFDKLQIEFDNIVDSKAQPESEVIQIVDDMLNKAVKKGASDIHIEAEKKYSRVRIRVDGALVEADKYEAEFHVQIVARLKVLAGLDIAEKRRSQDGRFTHKYRTKTVDLRFSTVPTVHGEKVVLRIIDSSALKVEFDDLGMTKNQSKDTKQAISAPNGMVLITGPTGSGKTTTVYSVLNEINTIDRNIITIEDPVEYNLEQINQIQVNTKADVTFTNTLRSILRQDPDIIMVGEMRDKETAELGSRAAITGHLVVTTLHTNDAASSIFRLVDMGVEPYLISSSLVCVVAQRLVRKLCDNCKVETKITEADLELIESPNLNVGDKVYAAKGCEKCNKTGYLGRLPVFEVLKVDDDIRAAIVKGDSTASIHKTLSKKGFVTLREHGIEKLHEGLTSVAEVLKATH